MTSYIAIQRIQKEKERKHLRGSEEIGKKRQTGRKRVSNEETGGACLYENLKLNDYN